MLSSLDARLAAILIHINYLRLVPLLRYLFPACSIFRSSRGHNTTSACISTNIPSLHDSLMQDIDCDPLASELPLLPKCLMNIGDTHLGQLADKGRSQSPLSLHEVHLMQVSLKVLPETHGLG